jgi:hypothetical protein
LLVIIGDMIMMPVIHMLCLLQVLILMVGLGEMSHAPRKMCNKPTTVFHACNATFVLSCKNEKVVARKLGSKCKGDKACIWVPKAIVTNCRGP